MNCLRFRVELMGRGVESEIWGKEEPGWVLGGASERPLGCPGVDIEPMIGAQGRGEIRM